MQTLYIKNAKIIALGGVGGVELNGIERNLTGSSFLIDILYNDLTQKKF